MDDDADISGPQTLMLDPRLDATAVKCHDI